MILPDFKLNSAGLSIHTFRTARRIIDWTWIAPEDEPAGREESPTAAPDREEAPLPAPAAVQ